MRIITRARSVTLDFTAWTDFERGSMVLQVLNTFNSTEAILPDIRDDTWLILDLAMCAEDFMGQTDPYGFKQPRL